MYIDLETCSSSSLNASKQKKNAPIVAVKSPRNKAPLVTKPTSQNPFLDDAPAVEKSNNPFLDDPEEEAINSKSKKQAPVVPVQNSAKSARNVNNFPMINDDEENIEWDSSEDEEIVKKELATFERNQVFIFDCFWSNTFSLVELFCKY